MVTDNWIYDCGAKALSEMLKVNKTLTSLDLSGEEERRKERERRKGKEE